MPLTKLINENHTSLAGWPEIGSPYETGGLCRALLPSSTGECLTLKLPPEEVRTQESKLPHPCAASCLSPVQQCPPGPQTSSRTTQSPH